MLKLKVSGFRSASVMTSQKIGCMMTAIIICVLLALSVRSASAKTACEAGLPPSKLSIFDIKPAHINEVTVSTRDLDRLSKEGGVESSHPSLAVRKNVVGWFQVKDHIIPASNGGAYCDAPVSVRIGLGYAKETLYMAEGVAANPCLRKSLLEHEAVHDRIDHAALDRFLDKQTSFLAAAMTALKRIPASGPQEAAEHWKVGVAGVVNRLKSEFQDEQQKLAAMANSPAELAKLESDCGSRFKQLESRPGDLL